MKNNVLILFCLFSSLINFSQKEYKHVKGIGMFKFNKEIDNILIPAAKKYALERARVSAMDSVLHTNVMQTFDGYSKSENEKNFTTFITKTKTSINGIWIKTDYENYSEKIDGEYYIVTCEVSGTIREKSSTQFKINAYTLNCDDINCKTGQFYDGSNLYVYFMSPKEGYIYIMGDDMNDVLELLPMKEKTPFHINARTDYIFFSKNFNNKQYEYPDCEEIQLKLNKDNIMEVNNIYIIYSRNSMLADFKPYNNKDMYGFESKAFNEWLEYLLETDISVTVFTYPISILPNE